jgi:hypothetical protein
MKNSTFRQIRSSQIRAILDDLAYLRAGVASDDLQYGIDENIAFFESLRSPLSYLGWLLNRAPRIDGRRLLELADLPLPRWQEELHSRLIEMEERNFPGIIAPLRNAIVDFILREHPRIVMDLGSGGMEVERQIIDRLIRAEYEQDICFIGVDHSDAARVIAKRNLAKLPSESVHVSEELQLSRKGIDEIFLSSSRQYQIVLCDNDIHGLPDVFLAQSVDLIFHSKLRHHLSDEKKRDIDNVTAQVGRLIIEYDNYRSWPFLAVVSLAVWRYPVMLNGAVFSRLRDPSKKKLMSPLRAEDEISFFKDSYLVVKRFPMPPREGEMDDSNESGRPLSSTLNNTYQFDPAAEPTRKVMR